MATFIVHITVADEEAPAVAQALTVGPTCKDIGDAIVQYVGFLKRGIVVEKIFDPTQDPNDTAYLPPAGDDEAFERLERSITRYPDRWR